MRVVSRLIFRLGGLLALPLVTTFILLSCTCKSGDNDGSDDTNNDDTDDDGDDTVDDDDDTTDDDAQGWHIYTIDTEPPDDKPTSIAIDSSDKVHISYMDHRFGETRGLKYATNKSGTWQKFIIDSYGGCLSLAIDSNDKMHISYHGSCSSVGCIKYTTDKTGSWQIFDVAEVGRYYIRDNSIALDSNGKAHVAIYYCGEFNEWDECTVGDLEYATNKNGAWQVVTIDSQYNTGKAPSIAVDSNGKAHICYFNSYEALKYATNAGTGWQKVVIDDSAEGVLFVVES